MMGNEVNRLRFGPYEVDLRTRELWKHGLRLKVVGQPFEILAVLASRPGELVTREELRAQLWPGDTFVDFNHGLNAAVNKLRDALSDSAEEPRYIETLPRRGYRFIAKVEQVGAENKVAAESAMPQTAVDTNAASEKDSRESPAELFSAAQTSKDKDEEIAEPKERFRRRWMIFVAALVVISSAMLITISHSGGKDKEHYGKDFTKPSLGPGIPLTNLPDPTSDPAFSPDGNRVAFRREGYAAGTSGIFVKPIGSPELLQLTNSAADCCPVWSPDGKMIAFSRFADNQHQIFSVGATGGSLRKLFATEPGPKRGELDWSPDGESIAFVGQSDKGTSSIFLLSTKNLTARRITEPPPLNHDRGPAFSPDGQTLAFIRTRESGLPETIVVMPAGGGEARVVATFGNGLLGSPAWTADGQSLLTAMGQSPLIRIPVFGGEQTEVQEAGTAAWHPTVSRRGYRLAYQRSADTMSLWQLDLNAEDKTQHSAPKSVVVTDTGRNEGAQISPDGTRLVFMSNRSGTMEIWVSDRDGSNAMQLTALRLAGTPRWSPDSRWIAFDRDTGDKGGIYLVSAAGGVPRYLAPSDGNSNLVPNWSHDGKWVYFASNRSGVWQVWKISPEPGSSPEMVTTKGGFAAWESTDGTTLYYSKFNMPEPEVWQMPVGGGLERRVSPLLRPEDWANWIPVEKGIYFVLNDQQPVVMFYEFASGQVKKMASLDRQPFWLSATADGKSVVFEHLDQENSHVMLVENFR